MKNYILWLHWNNPGWICYSVLVVTFILRMILNELKIKTCSGPLQISQAWAVHTAPNGQEDPVTENVDIPQTPFSCKGNRVSQNGKQWRIMAQMSLLRLISCMTLSKLIYWSVGMLINCHYEDLNEIYTKYVASCLLQSTTMVARKSSSTFFLVIPRKTLKMES